MNLPFIITIKPCDFFNNYLKKTRLQADILRDLGRAYYENAQYDSAMIYYMQAKDLYEKYNLQTEGHGVIFPLYRICFQAPGKHGQGL
ncbi:MAG: tetratricopeptide repeat protein [Crocinitomicaceae bacterium]|nr:tetratricopeptide repeat protein [Crocinitomicaceae bacterium]